MDKIKYIIWFCTTNEKYVPNFCETWETVIELLKNSVGSNFIITHAPIEIPEPIEVPRCY